MDRTLENKFFEAFSAGGFASCCIKMIELKQNLHVGNEDFNYDEYIYFQREAFPRLKSVDVGYLYEDAEKCSLMSGEELVRYYGETLPRLIAEKKHTFDDAVSVDIEDLIFEIEKNIIECQNKVQKERYIISLLIPFSARPVGCGFAAAFWPTEEISKQDEMICDCKKNMLLLQEVKKELLYDCNALKESQLYGTKVFKEIVQQNNKKGTAEYYLSILFRVECEFANRLDALLLVHGISLLRLQRDSGLYIKRNSTETFDICKYIGSKKLMHRCADNLAQEPQPEKTKPTIGRGRPKETFKDKMIEDADGEKLQKIHGKIHGKRGKDLALILLACIKKGWVTKPTFAQVKAEFGNIGSRQGFTAYLNEAKFSENEITGAVNSLD